MNDYIDYFTIITLSIVILITLFLLYNNISQTVLNIPKWKLISTSVIIKSGDCYDHKTILNVSYYSKSNNKIYYTDGCSCEYITQSGNKGMNVNVIISSDYMTYSQKADYANLLKNTFKQSSAPIGQLNYKFYIENIKGDCMKYSTENIFICTTPLLVFTTNKHSMEGHGGPGNIRLEGSAVKSSGWILHELGHSFGLSDYVDYAKTDNIKKLNSSQIAIVSGYSLMYTEHTCTLQQYLIKKCRYTNGWDFGTDNTFYYCRCQDDGKKFDNIRGCI